MVLRMARKPRVHIPGGVYHVMLRGNGGQGIFFLDEDRYRWYRLMEEGVERYGHRIHGFCLMTNHVHLAVQVGETPLSKIIQNLSFRYTRWVNHRQSRMGHLFQGRYKAVLVDGDAYLLELVRYIHLNPVRAGLVENPDEYPWSGHRAYLGLEQLPWMSTDWLLSQFAKRKDAARRRYARFVADGLGEGHREEFHGGGGDARILGDDRFIERVLAKDGASVGPDLTLGDVEGKVLESYRLTPAELAVRGRRRKPAEARGVIAALAVQRGVATLTEVARRYHRDVATLSEAVRRVQLRLNDSGAFRARYAKLADSINAIT